MNTKGYTSAKLAGMLVLVILLLLGGCRSSKSVRRGHSGSGKEQRVEVRTELDRVHGMRRSIVEEALSWEGTPYRYAASEKGSGTDCSGMVLRVFEDVASVKMPRNSQKQADFCDRIDGGKVRPGDLVFFATGSDPKRVSHVGVMLSETLFIHASSKKGVVISDITTPYYQRKFICYGRVPGVR